MAATFQAAGIAADALDGTTPLDERRGILHRLHTGETQVVCNCTVLTEGFDEPTLDCIIIARPTQSRPFYVQMLGRGTRTHPGKADCLVLDVVGVSTRHRLQTTAALFNLSPADAVTEPVAAALATQKRRQDALDAAKRGRLVHQMVDLFARRPLRWVRTHKGAWVLGLGQYGTLRLVPDGAETWRVVRLHRDGLARTLGTGLPLVYAQGQAEDLARRLGSEYLLDPQASWRQEDRETPAQQAHCALHQAEAALQALWALYDTQLDPLRHRWPQMFGRVLGHLSQTILHAQTLFEAYDYFQARCLEAGIGLEDAAVAWDMHSSEAFEAEIVEAESVGPNALRMIDQTLLAKLGIAPHDARPGEAMRCVWQGAGLVAAPDICMPSRHARVGVWHPWCAAGRAGEGTGVLRKARSAGERRQPPRRQQAPRGALRGW